MSADPALEPSSAPDAAPAPPRRPLVRRILIGLAVVVVLLVAFVAFLPAILSTSFAKDAIHGWLAENVDRKVDFKTLDVSWSDGIRLTGLVVGDDEDADRPFLEAPSVVIDAPLLPVLANEIRVRNFVVADAVVHVNRHAEGTSNATGVLRRRSVKSRRPHAGAPKPEGEPEAPAEDTVLPEIRVPLEVRNLTVVFRDAEGREARQAGIAFRGLLDTREGPTTFDLTVDDGPGSSLRVKGEAALFAQDGTLLGAARRKVDATVELVHLDAAQNRDFLALLVGASPVSGTLDGTIGLHAVGTDVKGEVDLRIAHAGYGDAAAKAATRQGEDLSITGRFESGGGKFRVSGWKVRADGLVIEADLAGNAEALEGEARADVDFARIAATLAAAGVKVPGTLAGRLEGGVKFTPSPSRGTGEFRLTGFRADGLVDGRPPVAIDAASVAFAASPSKDAFVLESFEARLADLTASARGTRAADGTLDLTATAKGDLGGLLARVRDLGFLPGGFAVNGDLDAELRVSGAPDRLLVTIPRCVLTETDVRIELSGTRDAAGALDVKASGAGDLGKLFGRAAAAGAGPQGIETVKGRFAFEATAKGAADALAIDVPTLRVDGDVSLDAKAHLAADGAIDASVTDLSGRVSDLVALLRRMALVDRDIDLGGTLALTASVRGTRTAPEVPRATLKLSGGAVDADVTGSVAASGEIAATAKLGADLAALAQVAAKAGFTEKPFPATGRLDVTARAAGTRDAVAVPEFRATLSGGPADAEVTGSLAADRAWVVHASADGDLDRLVKFAADQGWLRRATTPGGRVSLRADAAGRDAAYAVPRARVTLAGPLALSLDASWSAEKRIEATGTLRGAVQPALDLASAWSGEPPRRVDGTVDTSFAAAGTTDALDVRLPQFTLRAQGLAVDAAAGRAGDGSGEVRAKLAGPIADLLAVARAFGAAADVEATGRLDGDLTATLKGAKATAALALVASDLHLTKPGVGGAPFREPRLALSVPAAHYDMDTRTLEPVKAELTLEGLKLDATFETKGDVAKVAGRLDATRKFGTNHPELLPDVSFERAGGPFAFEGDVSHGREKAADWTGSFDFDAERVIAPYVRLLRARLPGKLAGGVLTIDPIDGVMNDGPVTGTAVIGLAGEAPSHRLVLHGKDVALDTDLAPLIAHASPIFALGEGGKTGGKAALDLDLTASGLDAKSIKRSLTGGGTMGLGDAYVESTSFLAEALQFLGMPKRLQLLPVSVPFQVKDSLVSTGELPFEAQGLSMRLGGHAGLDGKLDYVMRVKTSATDGIVSKLGSLVDKEGYLPLQVTGTLKKPKLKLPDLKDTLLGELTNRLGGKKDDEKEPDEKHDDGGKGGKRKGKKKAGETEPPPPPPPPPGETPKKDEPPPPPPPPPGEKPKNDEPVPPPPPPPGETPKKDEPPPPPPPPPGETPKKDEPPPPPPPPGEDPPPPPK